MPRLAGRGPAQEERRPRRPHAQGSSCRPSQPQRSAASPPALSITPGSCKDGSMAVPAPRQVGNVAVGSLLKKKTCPGCSCPRRLMRRASGSVVPPAPRPMSLAVLGGEDRPAESLQASTGTGTRAAAARRCRKGPGAPAQLSTTPHPPSRRQAGGQPATRLILSMRARRLSSCASRLLRSFCSFMSVKAALPPAPMPAIPER